MGCRGMDELCHSICICQFDIDRGDSFVCRFPSSPATQLEFSDPALARLALPEGSHERDEDWTHVLVGAAPRSDTACHVFGLIPLCDT